MQQGVWPARGAFAPLSPSLATVIASLGETLVQHRPPETLAPVPVAGGRCRSGLYEFPGRRGFLRLLPMAAGSCREACPVRCQVRHYRNPTTHAGDVSQASGQTSLRVNISSSWVAPAGELALVRPDLGDADLHRLIVRSGNAVARSAASRYLPGWKWSEQAVPRSEQASESGSIRRRPSQWAAAVDAAPERVLW